MKGPLEQGNESPSSIKDGELVHQLHKNSAPWSWLVLYINIKLQLTKVR
jgi:hypothetical protein